MPDLCDIAAEHQQREIEEALARQRNGQQPAEGRADCLDCGDEIPAVRRAAVPDACRCASCQTDHERSGWRSR